MYLTGCHHVFIIINTGKCAETKKKVDRNTSLFFLNVMIVSGIQTMKCSVHIEITSYF